MRKAAALVGLVLLAALVLWVGNGARTHLAGAPQAGLDLGRSAGRSACLQAALARGEACSGLMCGVGAGAFAGSCLALAEPDGACDRPLSCEGFACEQVRAQLDAVCAL